MFIADRGPLKGTYAGQMQSGMLRLAPKYDKDC